jgi:nitrogen fixation protein NifU and related proteins
MDKQIYREEILEHYRNPQNFYKLKNATMHASLNNPLCGDSLTVYIYIEKTKIKEVSFQGEGCAVSIAAASMMSSAIKEKKVKTVLKMSNDKVLDFLNLKLTPTRQKCALLFFEALRVAIRKADK